MNRTHVLFSRDAQRYSGFPRHGGGSHAGWDMQPPRGGTSLRPPTYPDGFTGLPVGGRTAPSWNGAPPGTNVLPEPTRLPEPTHPPEPQMRSAARRGRTSLPLSSWQSFLCPPGACRSRPRTQEALPVGSRAAPEQQRGLTDVFRERLERELGDSLQEALGDLARVKVVSKHPRLAEVLSKGLQRTLDEWRDRSEVKTHFVLLDYRGENYEFQARQHDGLTGLASPLVRRARTDDRRLVAKTAAVLVAQDLGWSGRSGCRPNPARSRSISRGPALVSPGEMGSAGRGLCRGGDAGGRRSRPATALDGPASAAAPGEVGPECVCRLFARARPGSIPRPEWLAIAA